MSRSEFAVADQCLKFCDETPSDATLPTLNNPWDLDSDCSAASFLVQWTQAHWNAGRPKRQCGVNGVLALCPAGPRSRSRYGELPVINLVRVRSHSNEHYFSIRLHKHKVRLSKFWNRDRNHRLTLCKKCFLPLSSADTSFTLWPDMLNFVWTNHIF